MVFKKCINSIRRRKSDGCKNRGNIIHPNGVILFAGIGYDIDFDKCISISEYLDKIDLFKDAKSSIFCDIIKQECVGSVYIDKSNTLVMTNKSFEGVLDTINENLSNLDLVDPVAHSKLVQDTLSFFEQKKVIVTQQGFQGAIYKAGHFAQSYGSTALTVKSVMMSRALGVTGSDVLVGQPLLIVTVPTIGGIFFHAVSMFVGQNAVGKSFQTVGNILLMPMKATELILNNIIFLPVGKFTGVPMLLNMTQTINMGPGLSIEDAKKLVNIVRNGKLSPIWKKFYDTYEVWFKK